MNLRPGVILFLAAILVVSWLASYVIYRAAEVGELVAPLEERSFSRLTVITVGTGGAYENPERLGPATALAWDSEISLVDAGRGIAEALRAAAIPVAQPRTVYLTSLLPVSTVGLDDLLLTGWLAPRESPLRVVGPPGTRALLEGLREAHRVGIEVGETGLGLPVEGSRFTAVEADTGFEEEVGGTRISAAALPGGPAPALAWAFERGGRRVVVGGVGWADDALVEFARGADLLIHEAVYIPDPDTIEAEGILADPERLRRERALHTSLLDVGRLAKRARVDALMLVRMRPPPFFRLQVRSIVDDTFDGRILVPADGDEYTP